MAEGMPFHARSRALSVNAKRTVAEPTNQVAMAKKSPWRIFASTYLIFAFLQLLTVRK